MRLIAAALLAATMLSGCADDNSLATYETQLKTLVGKPEADLTRRMGKPTRVSEAAGQRAVVYYLDWPGWTGRNSSVAGPDRFCEITFPIQQGKVASYSLRGKACGWDGYPEILPG